MAVTEKQKQAHIDYKAKNIKRIPLDVQNEEYKQIKDYAEAHGEKVNGFIKRAIRETMIKEE